MRPSSAGYFFKVATLSENVLCASCFINHS